MKLKVIKEKKKKVYSQLSFKKIRSSQETTQKVNAKKKKDANLAYLDKLNKIKAERKAQVEKNFLRDHAKAVKTHPYFLNIQKANAKKKKNS